MLKKVSVKLKDVVDELEMVNSEAYNMLNIETGEFIYYHEGFSDEDIDIEDFEEDCYIALPSSFDIHEYSIMEGFAHQLDNIQKQNALYRALKGRGAFRRFKDTLYEVGLEESWYKYREQEFTKIARKWCEEHEIPYEE